MRDRTTIVVGAASSGAAPIALSPPPHCACERQVSRRRSLLVVRFRSFRQRYHSKHSELRAAQHRAANRTVRLDAISAVYCDRFKGAAFVANVE